MCTTNTISFDVISTCNCAKCGKKIQKVFSQSIKNDEKIDGSYLQAKKSLWLLDKHYCNTCSKH